MLQRWHDLLFIHWPVSVEVIRPHLPGSLHIDTFDGQAWVGVVPFRLSGIRLRNCPPVPGFSTFPEINVRTYVHAGEKPGVWFLSLDADSRLAIAVARAWYRLPYFSARMTVSSDDGVVRFFSVRHRPGPPGVRFVGWYRPTGEAAPAEPGTLAHWLTERYCLYSADAAGAVYRAEIHHAPWPLQPAEAGVDANALLASHGIDPPREPPLLHFAKRLDAVFWSPERVSSLCALAELY